MEKIQIVFDVAFKRYDGKGPASAVARCEIGDRIVEKAVRLPLASPSTARVYGMLVAIAVARENDLEDFEILARDGHPPAKTLSKILGPGLSLPVAVLKHPRHPLLKITNEAAHRVLRGGVQGIDEATPTELRRMLFSIASNDAWATKSVKVGGSDEYSKLDQEELVRLLGIPDGEVSEMKEWLEKNGSKNLSLTEDSAAYVRVALRWMARGMAGAEALKRALSDAIRSDSYRESNSRRPQWSRR